MSALYGKVSQGPTGFNKFASNKYLDGTKEFLESNSIVAKFAFLLLVLLIFIVALRLGSSLLAWLFSPSPTPVLIDGMVDAKKMLIIPQNPASSGAKPVLRSVNEEDGLEFTWATWMYIDDMQYNDGQYKHVFHKGNDNINYDDDPTGLNFPNNAPGLYIAPNTNDLVIMMNTFNKIDEKIVVTDIPVNKWISVIIRCDSNKLDVYINGTLTRRHILKSVPKQNYGDVFVSMNGGFSGFTSDLRYFNYALGTSKIQSIVDKGPNMKMKSDDLNKTKPHYLSTRWFFAGNEDGFNP